MYQPHSITDPKPGVVGQQTGLMDLREGMGGWEERVGREGGGGSGRSWRTNMIKIYSQRIKTVR